MDPRDTEAKAVLKKQRKVGGLTCPSGKTYYEVTLTRLCGVGTRADIQIDGTDLRAWR